MHKLQKYTTIYKNTNNKTQKYKIQKYKLYQEIH